MVEEENLVDSLRLPSRKEKAAGLIADGVKQVKVAEIVGVTEQTMCAWCAEEDFKTRVEELRTDISKQVQEILNGGARRAALTVVDMASGNIDVDDVKELQPMLRASLYILDRFKAPKVGKSPKDVGKRGEKSATTEAELTGDEEAKDLLTR